MYYKCNYCDPTISKEMKKEGYKTIKSINASTDDYIRDEKNKYYHSECYVMHLMTKKKLSENKAIEKLKEQKSLLKNELQEVQNKSFFYEWIKNFYDSSLSSFFCSEITKISNGTHEKINEPVLYADLLEMYQKLSNYMIKKARTIQFKSVNQRMNYDLAIVIGKYGDYKKYKEKQSQQVETILQVDSKIEDSIKYEESLKNREIINKDEFDLVDVMDDLLL